MKQKNFFSLLNLVSLLTVVGIFSSNVASTEVEATTTTNSVAPNSYIDRGYGGAVTNQACSSIIIDSQLNSQICKDTTNPGQRNTSVTKKNANPQYNLVPRIQKPGNANQALLFPLSIPGAISSGFGWRLNPLTGVPQLHEGTDLVAPIGTPVLAAYSGKVEVARNLDGYGLVVYLRHEKDTKESRYAHLSAIFVQPGEWVEQGTVIGLVGNTGLSTGPHLHFEWREMTASGWVALNPQLTLENARKVLLSSLGSAKLESESAASSLSPSQYSRAPRAVKNTPEKLNQDLLSSVSIPETITSVFGRRIPLLGTDYFPELEK